MNYGHLSLLIFSVLLDIAINDETGYLRELFADRIPSVNWSCAVGSKKSASDSYHCIQSLDCASFSCYVLVYDNIHKNCCSVAAPYDWVVLQIGNRSLESKAGIDTYIRLTKEAGCGSRKQFINLWPPASAFFLDQVNQLTDFGYKRHGHYTMYNNILWTKIGDMFPGKSVMPKFSLFHQSTRSHMKIWPTSSFDFSRGFTVTVWTKVEAPDVAISPIFEFRTDALRHAIGWFWPSVHSNQLLNAVGSLMMVTGLNVVHNNGPWCHLSFSWSPDQRLAIHVNGTSVALNVQVNGSATSIITNGYLYIGAEKMSLPYFFNGGLACFFVYEKTLTTEEIKKVMKLC